MKVKNLEQRRGGSRKTVHLGGKDKDKSKNPRSATAEKELWKKKCQIVATILLMTDYSLLLPCELCFMKTFIFFKDALYL